MTESAHERLSEEVGSAAKIASVHADMIKIAPRKTYSMGGHDFSGMDYHGVLVRVRTEDGVEGLGEVYVNVGWYGPDTPLGYFFLINSTYGPAIVGESVFNTAKISATMDRLWMGNHGTKAALELAVYDAAAKTIGRPLVDLIGGRVRDRFPLVGGIGEDTPEGMAQTAREYVDRGFGTIKLKLGAPNNPDLDIARVRVVREEIGPEVILRVDANGAYGSDVRGAIKMIRAIESCDVEHVEQPLGREYIDGMARVRDAIDTRLMADESVHTFDDARRVIDAGAADLIKLKIAKNGGYRKSSEIITLCAQAGIPIELGNGLQSSVASLHELALACSNPGVHPAGEFSGPDKLVSDILVNPMRIEGGDAVLHDGPGIGSELDQAAFQACRLDMARLFRN